MEARPSLVQLMLLVPQIEGSGAGRLLPAAFEAMRERVAVEPRKPRDRETLANGTGSARVSLLHPDFTPAKGYPASWISLASAALDKTHTDLVIVGFSLGKDDEQLDHGWTVGLELSTLLVAALGAGLAFLNGGAIDDERSVFPADRSIDRPETITPWTYFGKAMLDASLRTTLEALPAFRSEPLGEGWQIQSVERLTDTPPPALLAALENLDPPIAYLGPRR